jgi:hypothetical protein
MKAELEKLVQDADHLGHDYDQERDGQECYRLMQSLGDKYPIGVLKQAVKNYQAILDDIENVQIPDMLLEIGMQSVTTEDGLKVGLKTEYNVSIIDPDGLSDWMESNGGGHLWKNSLKFEKGEEIDPVTSLAEELGLSFEQKNEIHPQTLKKFVKDFIEGGASAMDIPESAARVSSFTHAVIKRS